MKRAPMYVLTNLKIPVDVCVLDRLLVDMHFLFNTRLATIRETSRVVEESIYSTVMGVV